MCKDVLVDRASASHIMDDKHQFSQKLWLRIFDPVSQSYRVLLLSGVNKSEDESIDFIQNIILSIYESPSICVNAEKALVLDIGQRNQPNFQRVVFDNSVDKFILNSLSTTEFLRLIVD